MRTLASVPRKPSASGGAYRYFDTPCFPVLRLFEAVPELLEIERFVDAGAGRGQLMRWVRQATLADVRGVEIHRRRAAVANLIAPTRLGNFCTFSRRALGRPESVISNPPFEAEVIAALAAHALEVGDRHAPHPFVFPLDKLEASALEPLHCTIEQVLVLRHRPWPRNARGCAWVIFRRSHRGPVRRFDWIGGRCGNSQECTMRARPRTCEGLRSLR